MDDSASTTNIRVRDQDISNIGFLIGLNMLRKLARCMRTNWLKHNVDQKPMEEA